MAHSDDGVYRTSQEQAAYLRELREDRGWTIDEAEERSGNVYLMPGEIARAEREGVSDGYTMAALADLYGVPTLSLLHRPDLTLEQRIGLIERKLELYENVFRPIYLEAWEGEGFDPWDEDSPEERRAGLERCDREIAALRRRLVELQLQHAAGTVHGVPLSSASAGPAVIPADASPLTVDS